MNMPPLVDTLVLCNVAQDIRLISFPLADLLNQIPEVVKINVLQYAHQPGGRMHVPWREPLFLSIAQIGNVYYQVVASKVGSCY